MSYSRVPYCFTADWWCRIISVFWVTKITDFNFFQWHQLCASSDLSNSCKKYVCFTVKTISGLLSFSSCSFFGRKLFAKIGNGWIIAFIVKPEVLVVCFLKTKLWWLSLLLVLSNNFDFDKCSLIFFQRLTSWSWKDGSWTLHVSRLPQMMWQYRLIWRRLFSDRLNAVLCSSKSFQKA